MSKLFIVKIQRAVAYNHPGGAILVYNKDHSVMWEEEETPAMLKLMGSRHKAFYWAEIIDTKLAIHPERPARDPEW